MLKTSKPPAVLRPRKFARVFCSAFRVRPGRGCMHKIPWRWVLFIWFVCVPAHAQKVQFLPEVDAHLTLNSTFRAYLEAKEDRDDGDPRQAGIGPSIQLYLKPLIKLKKVKAFDLIPDEMSSACRFSATTIYENEIEFK